MNLKKTISYLFCCAAIVALILPSCKKNKSNEVNASYEKLGDVKVRAVTGFALNGDPLSHTADGAIVRWNSASKDWVKLGIYPTLPTVFPLNARCEDGQGNFYATHHDSGIYVLPGGSGNWIKLTASNLDTDATIGTDPARIFANNNGDILLQTIRAESGDDHYRIFKKGATSPNWDLVYDVAYPMAIDYLADNGDIYISSTLQGHTLIKAGTTTPIQMIDCGGATVQPYCDFRAAINRRGELILYSGGMAGSRHMYHIEAGATYPANAKDVFSLPEELHAFNAGFAYLENGTMMGEGNNGGYDPYFLYIRKAGASDWTKVPCLDENAYHNMNLSPNNKSVVYVHNASFAASYLYRLNY